MLLTDKQRTFRLSTVEFSRKSSHKLRDECTYVLTTLTSLFCFFIFLPLSYILLVMTNWKHRNNSYELYRFLCPVICHD